MLKLFQFLDMQQYNLQKCCIINYVVLILSIMILVAIIWVENAPKAPEDIVVNVSRKNNPESRGVHDQSMGIQNMSMTLLRFSL